MNLDRILSKKFVALGNKKLNIFVLGSINSFLNTLIKIITININSIKNNPNCKPSIIVSKKYASFLFMLIVKVSFSLVYSAIKLYHYIIQITTTFSKSLVGSFPLPNFKTREVKTCGTTRTKTKTHSNKRA